MWIRDETQAVSAWPSRSTRRPIPEPELDTTMSELGIPYEPQPEVFLRLVANPFLALFAFMLWLTVVFAIFKGAAGAFAPVALMLTIASLALLPRLLHYHCLDCGRTGALTQWRRHICPSVVARRLEGRARSIRGPSPTIQVLIWLWLLAALLVAWQSGNWSKR